MTLDAQLDRNNGQTAEGLSETATPVIGEEGWEWAA
jgi:hypothetical protein